MNGHSGSNSASFILHEYYERQLLNELGFQFSGDELSTFEAECYTIIKSEINRINAKEMKVKK